MTKVNVQKRALTLRKSGMSIGTIAKKLSVSKSTVSLWCRNIPLSEAQLQRISRNSKHHATIGLLKAAEQKRARRILNTEKATQKGACDVGTLSPRDIFMVGIGLYWGEGYKKGSQELGFTNSDPRMIVFYLRWLSCTYEITKEQLILRISINESHKQRISDIEKYWSQLTKIPSRQFTKPSLIKIKNTKVYPEPDTHFGTLRVKVRNGTDLRRRILGSIEALTK